MLFMRKALSKCLVATVLIVVTGYALPGNSRYNNTREILTAFASAIQNRDNVQERYKIYADYLERYSALLEKTFKAEAPDLLSWLDVPKPLRHGYGMLPRIISEGSLNVQQPRTQSAAYSWPWTESLIETGLTDVLRAEAELRHAALAGGVERRRIYENLATGYKEICNRQRNIDAHIQYNHLWQAAIAADRPAYDRETALYLKVVERRGIADTLKIVDDSALKEREKLLGRDIHNALDSYRKPDFVRIERRPPHLWVVSVLVYTDVQDARWVEAVKDSIEKIWFLKDGDNEFRVNVDLLSIPVVDLYAGRRPPENGEDILLEPHLALFPKNGAILTTGAATTHVRGRAIIVGSADVTARVLAHEFGHILGFKDAYFRGYKDLGKDGFEVMEMVADPADIMGEPETGQVLASHFSRILSDLATVKTVRHVNSL